MCGAGGRRHAPLHGPPQGYPLDGGWRGADPRTTHSARAPIEETTRSGVHLVTENIRPSRRGRRYRNSRDGVTVPTAVHREQRTDRRLRRRVGGGAR